MSKFNAEIAEIKITDSSYVTTAALNTKSLSANYAEISSINIGGKQARWESVTVVTGVTRKKTVCNGSVRNIKYGVLRVRQRKH